MERPAPLLSWQLDFKDVSSVPADPQGKQQHVVETLNIVDVRTSIVLDVVVRDDFAADSAMVAVTDCLGQEVGELVEVRKSYKRCVGYKGGDNVTGHDTTTMSLKAVVRQKDVS